METHANTVIDAWEEANTLVNEPVAVNSTPEDRVSIASQVSSGAPSGTAHVPDRASEGSSDYRYASISDDNSSQNVVLEMTDMCEAGNDITEESINESETEDLESGSGSRGRIWRWLAILGVALLIFVGESLLVLLIFLVFRQRD